MKKSFTDTRKHIPIATAMLGHALEHYEVTLYGFFAVILAPIFFPNFSTTAGLIASMGVFAMGFVMRPLGGIVFGHFGDKYGRRKCLLYTVLLASIPTIIIGLLPTYAAIGVAAPLVLIVCRLLQGFSLGGEYWGALIFVAEHSHEKKMGLLGSILCTTGYIGAIFGTLMGALFTLQIMPQWGWRFPFIIGGVLGLGIYFLRRNLPETPVLQEQAAIARTKRSPLFNVYKRGIRNPLCVLIMGGFSAVPLYLASIYLNPLLVTKFGLSMSQMMLVHGVLLVMAGGTMPLWGYFADKVGFSKWMILSASILCVISIPLFSLVTTDSLVNIFILQITLCVLGSSYHSALGGFFTSLFPPLERYSGIAFHSTLGAALFAGTAPLIATSLVSWTGNPLAPSFFLMTLAFITVIAIFLAKPINQRTSVVPAKKNQEKTKDESFSKVI